MLVLKKLSATRPLPIQAFQADLSKIRIGPCSYDLIITWRQELFQTRLLLPKSNRLSAQTFLASYPLCFGFLLKLRLDRPLVLSRPNASLDEREKQRPLTARTAKRLAPPRKGIAFYAPLFCSAF